MINKEKGTKGNGLLGVPRTCTAPRMPRSIIPSFRSVSCSFLSLFQRSDQGDARELSWCARTCTSQRTPQSIVPPCLLPLLSLLQRGNNGNARHAFRGVREDIYDAKNAVEHPQRALSIAYLFSPRVSLQRRDKGDTRHGLRGRCDKRDEGNSVCGVRQHLRRDTKNAVEHHSFLRASSLYHSLSSGVTKETRGTAFVVYEDIYDAKNAVEHLSGFNVANRYLIVLYYQQAKFTKKIDQKKNEEELDKMQKKYGVSGEQK
ncbi:unnamed protein product [Closterium sp. NIES-65]|nr:unnamed protein product [Closterium sp. NIES-65]